MKDKRLLVWVVNIVLGSLLIMSLVNCGGHYKYCIESAHYDSGTESKTLNRPKDN